MRDACGCSILLSAAHPITNAAHNPRCAFISDLLSYIWWSTGSLKPTSPLAGLGTDSIYKHQCKTQENHPKYHNGSAEALALSALLPPFRASGHSP